MKKKASRQIVPPETIKDRIFIIRGLKVILDKDLAELYGVPTKRLNEQVRRNHFKFPADFVFRLTKEEVEAILTGLRTQNAATNRSQFATGSQKHRDPRFLPYAFSEYGALQAANVLNSAKATAMSIYVIRAFVRLREVFVGNQILEERLSEIEKILLHHDVALEDVYEKIRLLLLAPKMTDAIGFQLTTPRPGKIG